MFNNNKCVSNIFQVDTSQINEPYDQQTKKNHQPIPYDQRKLSQITIKQIQTAKPPQPNEHLKIDGIEISQVMMIAQIVSINANSSQIALKVNDLSGSLEVTQWTNNADDEKKNADDEKKNANVNMKVEEITHLVPGRWVKITGRINHFNGRCSVNAFEIDPIIDFNEITYHFLECIHQHLQNTVGHLDQNQNSNEIKNFNMILDVDVNTEMNNNNYGINNDNKDKAMDVIVENSDYLSVMQNKILQIINSQKYNTNEIGCNVEIIFEELSEDDIDQIREAIELLSDEGYIYSTVDDDHYKYSGH